MVRIDFNPSTGLLRVCDMNYIIDAGFYTIANHVSEAMANHFIDYADGISLEDEVFHSVKSMRSFFNEWRTDLYDDDF